MLPLLHPDKKQALALANGAIQGFAATFKRHWLAGMRAKLGLFTDETDDTTLIENLLEWMRQKSADFTNTFRALSAEKLTDDATLADPDFRVWHARWQARLGRQPQSLGAAVELMRAHNPAFIPRNHKVEEALEAATERGDLQVMQRLLNVLAKPYENEHDNPEYSAPPAPSDHVYQTFCGT